MLEAILVGLGVVLLAGILLAICVDREPADRPLDFARARRAWRPSAGELPTRVMHRDVRRQAE